MLEIKIKGVTEDQSGFGKGKSTRDSIGLMRIVSKSVLDIILHRV